MARYKLIIAYDGTRYAGWQEQTNAPTVSGTMRKKFSDIFGSECTLLGASRTDAGVHAHGQVALCVTERTIEADRLLHVWNRILPLDISIRELQTTPDSFHPLQGVVSKTYRYSLFRSRPLPAVASFGWYYEQKINVELLQRALQLFVGTHDFSNFAAAEDAINPIRTIEEIQVRETDSTIEITVRGQSFIRHMIRRIIGAAVTVAARHKNRTLSDIRRCLLHKESKYCFENAAPQGLLLYTITYDQRKDLT